jgi:hypothetical protein
VEQMKAYRQADPAGADLDKDVTLTAFANGSVKFPLWRGQLDTGTDGPGGSSHSSEQEEQYE